MRQIKQIKFRLPDTRGFSVNAAYVRSRSHGSKLVRNKNCRDWGDSVLHKMQPHVKKFQKFRETFDPTIDALSVKLIFNIPRKSFFTKSEEISIFTLDLSNLEKLLLDLIFDDRFHGRTVFYEEVSNIAINDKFITQLYSEKRPVDEDEYSIDIHIKKINNGRQDGTENE